MVQYGDVLVSYTILFRCVIRYSTCNLEHSSTTFDLPTLSLMSAHGTVNAERYMQVLEQHMLPSRWCLFQGRRCLFHQYNAWSLSAQVTTVHNSVGIHWAACSPNVLRIEDVKRNTDPRLLSDWGCVSRKIFNFKTSTLRPQFPNTESFLKEKLSV